MSEKGKEAARFRPNRALSAEEAGNIASAMGELTEQDMRDMTQERMKATPPTINDMSERSMRRFLKYAISLMSEYPRLALHQGILKLRVEGMTVEQIAFHLRREGAGNITVEQVREKEKDGLKYAQEVVARKRANGIPLIGEPAA
jgi:hypothetical protein